MRSVIRDPKLSNGWLIKRVYRGFFFSKEIGCLAWTISTNARFFEAPEGRAEISSQWGVDPQGAGVNAPLKGL